MRLAAADIRAKLSNHERHTMGHKAADKVNVAAEPVQLGDGHIAPELLCSCESGLELWSTVESIGALASLKARLIANLDPNEWDFPPKPKWMRWRTYNNYVARYDAYDAVLDYGCATLKFTGEIAPEKCRLKSMGTFTFSKTFRFSYQPAEFSPIKLERDASCVRHPTNRKLSISIEHRVM